MPLRIRVPALPEPAGGGASHTLFPSDSVTMSDALTKAIGATLADTLNLADSNIAADSIVLADSVTMSDFFSSGSDILHTLFPADSVTMSDSIANAVAKLLADTLSTPTDVLTKAIGALLADSATMSDSPTKAASVVFADALTITDLAGLGRSLTLADTVSLSDLASGVIDSSFAHNHSVDDTVSLADVATTNWLNKAIRPRVIDYRLRASPRPTDTRSRTLIDYTAPFSPNDTFAMSDSIAFSLGYMRDYDEIVTVADAAVFGHGKAFSDTVTMSDGVVIGFAFSRAVADSVTMSDNAVTVYGPQFNDSVTMSDALIKAIGASLADTTSLADTLGAAFTKVIADTIPLSDAATTAPSVTLADTVSLADSAGTALTDGRIIYVNQTSSASGSSPAKPSGIAVGRLVFVVTGDSSASGADLVTTGGRTWNRSQIDTTGIVYQHTLFWQILDADDVANAWTFTNNGGYTYGSASLHYDIGAGTTITIKDTDESSGTTKTLTGFVKSVASKGVITIGVDRDGALTPGVPAGFTSRLNVNADASGLWREYAADNISGYVDSANVVWTDSGSLPGVLWLIEIT